VERLISEQSWLARLALLDTEPRLVDGSVARWCAERGEGLLAGLIVRAGEVGVAAAGTELPVALELLSIAQDTTGTWQPSEAVRVFAEAARLAADGSGWLESLLLEVVDVVVTHINANVDGTGATGDRSTLLAPLRAVLEPLLAHIAGSDPAHVTRMLALAREDWGKVWAALPALMLSTVGEADTINRVCSVAHLVAEWFEVDRRVASWVKDLEGLARAARQRGPEAAVQEHRLVLSARAAPVDDRIHENERANTCSLLAAESADYYQRTGAAWLLEAALEAGRAAYELTLEGDPDLAGCASVLGSLLAMAVQAGVLEPGMLGEATDYLREAYQLTPENHPDLAGRASSLGSRLAYRAGFPGPARSAGRHRPRARHAGRRGEPDCAPAPEISARLPLPGTGRAGRATAGEDDRQGPVHLGVCGAAVDGEVRVGSPGAPQRRRVGPRRAQAGRGHLAGRSRRART
jgi:hypothetical protein